MEVKAVWLIYDRIFRQQASMNTTLKWWNDLLPAVLDSTMLSMPAVDIVV